MKIGLIFGKFAPFHKGHEAFIRAALTQCDALYVLVNEHPELIRIPAQRRAEWIVKIVNDRRLFVATGGIPPETGETEELKKANLEHIRKHLPSRIQIDTVFCNEWYGGDVAKDLGAKWVQIDPDRTIVPVSATMIRNDPRTYSKYLDPIVAKTYREVNITP